ATPGAQGSRRGARHDQGVEALDSEPGHGNETAVRARGATGRERPGVDVARAGATCRTRTGTEPRHAPRPRSGARAAREPQRGRAPRRDYPHPPSREEGMASRLAVAAAHLPQRLEEIKASLAAGAREIDVVITRAHALAGEWEALYDEIRAFRDACGQAHMKVILGTGDLATLANVARASQVAMMAGADFI